LVFDVIFPREYLRAALVVSLLSIWVLVLLFYYLNRYTKRGYFTIWTAAWLFYALWLTLGLSAPNPDPKSFLMIVRQWCVGISAVFLLWGSLAFLEIKVRQTLFGLFMAFLLTWSYISPQITTNALLIQMPLFLLIGMSSIFAGVSFYRLRKRRQFVGVGLLFFGFFLWGVYLATYPLTLQYENLFSAGFLVSAVLQLFIAVSMIVLVLEEARYLNEQVQKQIQAVRSEKEAIQLRMINAEEKYRSLFDQNRTRDDLQKAYDELRQTQQSVVQQERLRALGQMASGIAHDVNNALSPVLAFADMVIRKEPDISAASRKNLEHIKTAAEDIAHIVERMSEFYRRREENQRLRLVNLNRLVEQVVELTRPRWQDMVQNQGIVIRVETMLDESVPQLYANESELRETLTNLILNSVDAMPKGGTITLGIRGLSANAEFFSSGPSHLVLEVRDTGVGMDEKTRQRCLEPFFSTKRDRGGTGLGLAMVYGVTERHEGTIEVESELGKGTTMRLILPLRQAPAAGGDGTQGVAAARQPLRVLCIDDEPLLRELLKEVLEFEKHEVVTADGGQTGLQAFQAARDRGEPFDIVITDLGMPHIDGRSVAHTIKTNSPETPVVMLTGWGIMLNERGDLPTNVDAILSKPPRPAELHETLIRVVHKRRKVAA
jgi:signal transduction histidine kinase/ActR/RegA family two-component response regulator